MITSLSSLPSVLFSSFLHLESRIHNSFPSLSPFLATPSSLLSPASLQVRVSARLSPDLSSHPLLEHMFAAAFSIAFAADDACSTCMSADYMPLLSLPHSPAVAAAFTPSSQTAVARSEQRSAREQAA